MMTDITIEIDYGEGFERQIKSGTADPIVVMSVYIGGKEVKKADSFMSRTIAELLEAVDSIFAGEKQIIEYTGGPTYLVFEPRDEETIFVTGCGGYEAAHNPEERLSIDTTAICDKRAWVTELVREAEEYREKILNLNPELEDDMFLQRIQASIANANRYLDESENKPK